MRRLGRFVLTLLGLVCLLGGSAVAAYVGSDDTVFNRATALGEDGRPVLTAPDLLAWDGVTVTLRAQAPEGVFIGTAHPVDVADFIGDSPRVRLEGVTRDGVLAAEVGEGSPRHPEDVDFWTRSMRGSGPQELALDRTASATQWVIAPLGGTGPTTVSFGVTVEGTYAAALGVAGTGLLLLVVAVELLRPRRPRPSRRGGARKAGRPGPRSPGAALPLVAALATVLAATGCQLPQPSTDEATRLARTKVSITEADLPALYASYDARRARAARAAGPPAYRPGPWRAADRGPALAVDRYETALRRTMGLGRVVVAPHTGLRVYAARFDSYPMWAMVAARAGDDVDLHVMVRTSVTAPWRLESRTAVSGDLPDAGRPTTLPAPGVRTDATGARTAWRDYLVAGTGDGLRVDAASRGWRRAMSDLGSRAIFRGWDVTATPVQAPVRVVRVADGHLAVVTLRLVTRLRGRPDLAVRWNPPYGRFRSGAGGVLAVDEVATGLVHLPDDGRPELLGTTFSEVPAGAP